MSSAKELRLHHLTKAAKLGEVDRVYQLLKNWLIECELAPGEALSEIDLAARCETSRTPIREACNRLAQDRWLTRIPHKGYLVAPISVRELLQVYEYRKLLECFGAERAAQTATPGQLEELGRIIAVESAANADFKDILAASDSFHLTIAQIAGNQRVLDQLKLTLELVRRMDALSGRKDHTWIPHADVCIAIRSHMPVEARQAMATHIDHARDRILRLLAS